MVIKSIVQKIDTWFMEHDIIACICCGIYLWFVIMGVCNVLDKTITKPLSEKQYQYCEQIATNIYNEPGSYILNIPDNVEANANNSMIKVGLVHHSGIVKAEIEDGNLNIERADKDIKTSIIKLVLYIVFGIIAFVAKEYIIGLFY